MNQNVLVLIWTCLKAANKNTFYTNNVTNNGEILNLLPYFSFSSKGFFKKVIQYLQPVYIWLHFPVCRAMSKHAGPRLPAIVECLCPSLNNIYECQRITVTAFFSEVKWCETFEGKFLCFNVQDGQTQ